MEPADTPPMSGSNSICVATVLLDTGIVPMTEPVTRMVLEPPGGLIEVEAECRGGKAERIIVRNVPAFADRLDAALEVAGLGTLTVDPAYGGDSFVLVDAAATGLEIRPENARAGRGRDADHQGRQRAAWLPPSRQRLEPRLVLPAHRPGRGAGRVLVGKSAVAIRPGKIDRSPTGTGWLQTTDVFFGSGRLEAVHEAFATLILALVAGHLGGILLESWRTERISSVR